MSNNKQYKKVSYETLVEHNTLYQNRRREAEAKCMKLVNSARMLYMHTERMVDILIDMYDKARDRGDYETADNVRMMLEASGFKLETDNKTTTVRIPCSMFFFTRME